jgi:peptide/nickel transport system permease protein
VEVVHPIPTTERLEAPSLRRRPGPLRRFSRNPSTVAALGYLLVVILAAICAPVITPHDPNRIEMGATLLPPSAEHWLGTDESGRDEFTRLLHGARISLAIGVVAMLLSVVLGTAIGSLAGFFGGVSDALTMRLTDAMLSIPIFFFLLTVLAVFGSDVPTIIIAIGLSSWMTAARVVRAEVLRTINLEYVLAARAHGAGNWRIVLLHLLPSAVPSMMVASTIGVGQAILTESALSYLGVGVQPPVASWGNMLSNAQNYFFPAPLLAIWPGMLILFTVLSFNFIGDSARDTLSPYQN